MTKFNFSTRKIRKKRKRKEDKLNTTSAPSESSCITCSSWFTYLGEYKTKKNNSSTGKQEIENQIQTKKRSNKKINITCNTKKIPKCISRFLTTTPRWTWKKSKTFTLKQKKSLFKSHNISKTIETFQRPSKGTTLHFTIWNLLYQIKARKTTPAASHFPSNLQLNWHLQQLYNKSNTFEKKTINIKIKF